LAGTGAEEAAGEEDADASALTFFSFLTAGSAVLVATGATTATGVGAGAGADSFFATRLTAGVGLELIILVPVELFSIFKRTSLHLCDKSESKFLLESKYLASCDIPSNAYSIVYIPISYKYLYNVLQITSIPIFFI
jgi:hypothetical protein